MSKNEVIAVFLILLALLNTSLLIVRENVRSISVTIAVLSPLVRFDFMAPFVSYSSSLFRKITVIFPIYNLITFPHPLAHRSPFQYGEHSRAGGPKACSGAPARSVERWGRSPVRSLERSRRRQH